MIFIYFALATPTPSYFFSTYIWSSKLCGGPITAWNTRCMLKKKVKTSGRRQRKVCENHLVSNTFLSKAKVRSPPAVTRERQRKLHVFHMFCVGDSHSFLLFFQHTSCFPSCDGGGRCKIYGNPAVFISEVKVGAYRCIARWKSRKVMKTT